MRRDGVALILALLVPVIAFAILTLTFSNAVIRNLRVAIVDADRSATSLIYVQSIASAPGVTVAERSSDMRSAMQAVRSGDAIAAVYIPENFERDLLARKRPQVVSLYNRQYFTPGNNAASAISERHLGGDRCAAARCGRRRLQAGRPRRRTICPVEPGAELRPVPAAGGSAHRAARRRPRSPAAMRSARSSLGAASAPGCAPPAAGRWSRSSASSCLCSPSSSS